MSLLLSTRLQVSFGALVADELIDMGCGVYQGSPLSPTLFIVAITTLEAELRVQAATSAALHWTTPLASILASPLPHPPSLLSRTPLPASPLHPHVTSTSPSPTPTVPSSFASCFYADDTSVTFSTTDPHTLSDTIVQTVSRVDQAFRDRGMVINVKDDGSKSALAVWFPDYTTHRDFSNALSTATDAATHGTDPDPDSDTDNGDTVPSLLQRLPTVDQYNDLGLLRSFSRTSNTRQLQQQLLVTASQAVRGRTVKTGLSTVSARLALTVYKSILLPALTYGLQLWCLSPKDVPAKVSQLHHSNIITLVGRGPHTSVSKTCLFAALGVVPVWAYGLSLATGHVARVLSLPMRHPLRLAFATAATDAVDAIRTSGGDHQHVQRCWWTHVASLLSLGLDHSEDFSFIYDDLIKSLSPPLVKLTLAASSTTIAVPCPPLHSPPTQEWTVHFPRSKEYLKQVVCRIVLNHWRNVWSPAQRVMTNVYFPKHTSSGSSFEETVEWLSCAVPWTPFPLVSGRRNASFKLRIAALGGLGCVIDNRNLAFLRTLTVCPLCDCDDG